MQIPWHLSVGDSRNKLTQVANICCKFQKNTKSQIIFNKKSEGRLLQKDALFDSIFAGLFI